ncbi:cuticle protein 10.9-like [Parasteatoda tepidariorum]|uniref:cuticle protein 10.9-like n=1 Tax=Parasteatoda tepidariorum TaxID=114398 RepID=UPI00077FB8BA|nr:cuticle protein 10.9-like [Parasteatoda tepidariorum]
MTLAFVQFCFGLVLFTIATAGPIGPTAKPEEIYYPRPYDFGYQMDNGNGTMLHRQETADEDGSVKGSYGYVDGNGYWRTVEYNAGKNGYHAKVSSNEPGVISQNSADAVFLVKLGQP